VGINGKNSEFHAAMGICNLKYIDDVLARRKEQWQRYEMQFEGTDVRGLAINPDAGFNYAYYPAIFETEAITLCVKASLEQMGISPRRYFYPSLCKLDYVAGEKTDISVDISK